VTETAANSPQAVTLTGTGIADLTTSVSSLTFTNVKFGAAGVKTFSVTNHQTQQVTLSEGLSGANSADFSITGATTCTTTLAAHAACLVTVAFAPSVLGTESATLTISDNPDPLGPHTIALSGAGVTPVKLTPATTLAFGTVARPKSKALTITVTNLGTTTLRLSTPAISGVNATDFLLTTAAITPCGLTLAGGASCHVGVTFKPSVASAFESASVAIGGSPDAASPHNVILTGTGQ
jgi:hypothetical protein